MHGTMNIKPGATLRKVFIVSTVLLCPYNSHNIMPLFPQAALTAASEVAANNLKHQVSHIKIAYRYTARTEC
jgi:hypothetical protein